MVSERMVMYRIRFHGRGGQGVKTASRILATALFYQGFEVQDAPLYGAERRGAPMSAHLRAADARIDERGLITHPDLVIVVDESLIPVPAANVLVGATSRTVLLINSAVAAAQWRRRLNLAAPIVTLPASAEVASWVEFPSAGAICAGAAAQLVGRITRDSLARAIREELRESSEETVERNLERALDAYDTVEAHTGIVSEGVEISAQHYTRPDWVDVPLEPPRLSAPDIHASATSVLVQTGAWRTTRPVIDSDRCNRCTWVCSTLCPDSAIRVKADGRPEIDYIHCKGCLICVAVCPPHAIHAVPEFIPIGEVA